MGKNIGGRPSIFGPKDEGTRFRGVMTTEGGKAFERRRQELADLVGWPVAKVSDGDTQEYIALGEIAARTHLKKRKLLK